MTINNYQQTTTPVDNSIFVKRKYAELDQIITVSESAKEAQVKWKACPISERINITQRAIEYLLEKQEELSAELSWQMGRPIRYAKNEISGLSERANYMISIAQEALKPHTLPEKNNFQRYITREALGVILVIAPWNYPYLTAINTLVPAILAGNSVILKHSAQTPLCAERLQEAFHMAGLPEGVFQYLHITHRDTAKLIHSENINYVAFTGSVTAGKAIEQAAAGKFIGVGLELGGKDPAYVRADADIDYTVEAVMDGAFFNSGQSCCGIERIYVHEAIYEKFLTKSVALVKKYQLGNPTDPSTTLGPLVKTEAANFIREQIDDALEQGAVAHIDERAFPNSKAGTPYLAPQILSNVNHSMRVMTEESFGPVVGIQKVASDEEALTLMNDSDFGLTASIFTKDTAAGISLGEKINTGTFFINRCDYLDPALAWTGVKDSGRGCTLSKYGFDALTRPKSFHIKTLS